MVACTVTVPAALAVRVFPLILAPMSLELLVIDMVQVMVLLVALEGFTVPERYKGVPAVAVVGTPVIDDTGTKSVVIVMRKSCV